MKFHDKTFIQTLTVHFSHPQCFKLHIIDSYYYKIQVPRTKVKMSAMWHVSVTPPPVGRDMWNDGASTGNWLAPDK